MWLDVNIRVSTKEICDKRGLDYMLNISKLL